MIGRYPIGTYPIAGSPLAEEAGFITSVCFDGEIEDLVWNGEETSLQFNGIIQTNCDTFSKNNC